MLGKFKQNYSISKYYKEAADIAELVYFGSITHDDDFERHKGVTFSHDSKDSHLCHGTVKGYDVSLFNRSAEHATYDGAENHSDWTVVVVQLKAGGFPNLVIDARKHDKVFYSSIFTRFPKLRRGNEVLQHINPSASQYFDLFIAPQSSISVLNMLDDTVLQRMIQQYGRYDVQIEDNTLTVFARGRAQSTKQLTDMVYEAIWLSEKIEYKNAYSLEAAGLATVSV